MIHRGRNLVICIDGTSNQFGRHVELFSHHRHDYDTDHGGNPEYECYRAI